MATEILSSHFNNILHYIKDTWDETDSTYHVYTLISDYFYYLNSDLWKLFKTIKFDSEFLHVDLEYNEANLTEEGIKKNTIVYYIVHSILKDNAYMPIEEEDEEENEYEYDEYFDECCSTQSNEFTR